MEKLILTALLAIFLLAPQTGLQAKGNPAINDINARIDELEKRILALETSEPDTWTFSGNFAQGEAPDISIQNAWFKFTSDATGLFTAIEIRNNLGGSAICSDAGKSTDIANALNGYMVGGPTETFECGGRFWNVGGAGGGAALSAGPTKAVDDCNEDAAVRPLVTHENWGGIGLTCDAPTQTLEVILTR